jgi:hypothetical protein
MPAYRVYCLDGARRITKAEWYEAENDDEVIAVAREECVPCEVWERGRLVATIPTR